MSSIRILPLAVILLICGVIHESAGFSVKQTWKRFRECAFKENDPPEPPEKKEVPEIEIPPAFPKEPEPEVPVAQIPIDIAEEMLEADNPVDILIAHYGGYKEVSLTPRSGARKKGRPATPDELPWGKCEPELQTVQIEVPLYNSWYYPYPTCVRVKRCGGCCPHPLLDCQPTATEMLEKNVTLVPANKDEQLGYMLAIVESHKECQCSCKTKVKDCNQNQEFKGCLCVCKPEFKAARAECQKDPENRLWSPDECRCRCRKEEVCQSGFYFSPSFCACVKGTN